MRVSSTSEYYEGTEAQDWVKNEQTQKIHLPKYEIMVVELTLLLEEKQMEITIYTLKELRILLTDL